LVIGSSLLITTNNYYTIAGLRNLQSLHANLLSVLSSFTYFIFIVTELHTPNVTVLPHTRTLLFHTQTLHRPTSCAPSFNSLFRLMTDLSFLLQLRNSAHFYRRGTTHPLNTSRDRYTLLLCDVTVCSLHRNGPSRVLRELSSNGRCLHIHCLARVNTSQYVYASAVFLLFLVTVTCPAYF
jgi:hypothetical protein